MLEEHGLDIRILAGLASEVEANDVARSGAWRNMGKEGVEPCEGNCLPAHNHSKNHFSEEFVHHAIIIVAVDAGEKFSPDDVL
jgi:hypothetical protein